MDKGEGANLAGCQGQVSVLETVPLLFKCKMFRQLCAEAVISNVLDYFHSTKQKRSGLSIASRDFLLSIAFHKRGFDNVGLSSRDIADGVSINRNTLLPYLANTTPLETITFQPYKKECASNDWKKREVRTYLFYEMYKSYTSDTN